MSIVLQLKRENIIEAIFSYLETNMSFDMGNYFVDEEDGTVQVTLKLTKRLPFNSTLQLITINETASELYSVNSYTSIFYYKFIMHNNFIS